MSRRRRGINRRPVTDAESLRVSLLAQYGFHYRTIAKRLYGDNISDSDVARVGRIARSEGVSSMDWRKGETKEAQRVLSRLGRNAVDKPAPKLRLTA